MGLRSEVIRAGGIALLAGLVSIGSGIAAHGEPTKAVRVHGQVVQLVAPTGFCFVDERKDAIIISLLRRMMPGEVLIIGAFYPCPILEMMRTGRPVADSKVPLSGIYLTPSDPTIARNDQTRSVFVANVQHAIGLSQREEVDRVLSNVMSAIAHGEDLASLGMELGKPVFIGALGADQSAAYDCILINASFEGKPAAIATVSGITVTNGLEVHGGFSGGYVDGRTVSALKVRVRHMMAALIEANRR